MGTIWLEEMDIQKVLVKNIPECCSACAFLALQNSYTDEDCVTSCLITDKIIDNADIRDQLCKLSLI